MSKLPAFLNVLFCGLALSACAFLDLSSDTDVEDPEVGSFTIAQTAELLASGNFAVNYFDYPEHLREIRLYSYSDATDAEIKSFAGYNAAEHRIDALVALEPSSELGAIGSSGTVTYAGQWGMTAHFNFVEDDEALYGFTSSTYNNAEPITLTGNFDDGTLTGSDDTFRLDARISGGTIDGSVFITLEDLRDGAEVELTAEGMIGVKEVNGAFHGNADDFAISGGFIGWD